MSAVDNGKWTCPQCGRTTTVYATEGDTACCLDAVRRRHGRAHRRIVGLPGARVPAQRGAARAVNQPVGDETTPAGISTPAKRGRVSSERNGEP